MTEKGWNHLNHSGWVGAILFSFLAIWVLNLDAKAGGSVEGLMETDLSHAHNGWTDDADKQLSVQSGFDIDSAYYEI